MSEHDRDLLGAYALGVLDPDEITAIDQHVASCPACREDLADLVEMKDSLGEVPPEAFLDGPPEGGDLLLQRTLREVRRDKAQAGRQRLVLAAAGIVALAAVAAGAGVVAGHGLGARGPANALPSGPPPGS